MDKKVLPNTSKHQCFV